MIKTEKFLISNFKTRSDFSICPLPNQTRKELCNEVDNIVGHLNYGATNYNKNYQGCFDGKWENK